jgi:hypothetical protein
MKATKTIFMLSAALLLGGICQAQTYTSLADDASGDVSGGATVADLKKVSYRVDHTKDSIWFKLEFHNEKPASADFGFLLGLDTNLVITDGVSWTGSNTSMKYDHAVFIAQNGMMEPGVVRVEKGTVASHNTLAAMTARPDNKTVIVGFKLSAIDNNGNFNMLVGSGSFDISSTGTVFDDAPQSSYVQIRKNTTGIEYHGGAVLAISAYPNPATNTVSWNYAADTRFVSQEGQLLDITGKVLASFPVKAKKLDISNLSPGMYFLKFDHTSIPVVKQ